MGESKKEGEMREGRSRGAIFGTATIGVHALMRGDLPRRFKTVALLHLTAGNGVRLRTCLGGLSSDWGEILAVGAAVVQATNRAGYLYLSFFQRELIDYYLILPKLVSTTVIERRCC